MCKYVSLAVLLFLGLGLAAQNREGEVSGRVTDSAGAGIAGATLEFSEVDGTNKRQVVTGADGSFTVLGMPPGNYKVTLTGNGSTRATTQTLRLDTSAPSTVSLTLNDTSGADGGKIELTGTAPTLQTESTEVSRAYDTTLVRQLPVLDRQAQQLIGLMPGVTPPVTSSDPLWDPQRRRDFNVNGLPTYANGYFQDGAYQTDPWTANIVRVTPNEAIQSLNIRTSNYNAEHGFAAGAWTNTVTRPGQNQVHGSLFGFHTNSFLGSRNPLNNQGNAEAARFNQNQFGASMGGPLRTNSVFLFGAYEGFLRRGRTFEIETVPTSAMRVGDFSAFNGTIFNPASGFGSGSGRTPFTGNQIPASRINPFAARLLTFIPDANREGFVNNLTGAPMLRQDNHRGDLKLDYRPTDRVYGFARYGYTHADVEKESLLGALGNQGNAGLRNHAGAAGVSFSVTPTLIGEFRGGFSRYRNLITPFGLDSGLSNALDASGFSGVPSIDIAGLSSFGGASSFMRKPVSNILDGATNWSHHNGRHRLSFGAVGRAIRASGYDMGAFSPFGSFSFGPGATSTAGAGISSGVLANSFAAFLTGAPSQSGVAAFTTTPTYHQEQYSAHITDTINISQRVYFELGVRYDVFSPVRTRFTANNQIFDPTTGTVADASVNSVYDLNNIAPRVGIAIRPHDRVAFRAGYGVHYFALPYTLAGLNQAARGVQLGSTGAFGTTAFTLPAVPSSNASGLAPNFPFNVARRDLDTPYVQTLSAMIQGDLGQGFLLDIGYVGNIGRQMPLVSEWNAALPGTGLSGLPGNQFGRTASTTLIDSGANSSYNSLQANLTKRYAKGLALTAAYTYSKALDYGSTLLVPFDRRSNYGPADWDRKHMVAFSHLWRLPFGTSNRNFGGGVIGSIFGDWELNGILHWASGTPYTVLLDPLTCNCPGVSGLIGAPAGTIDINGATSFDPNAFSIGNNQVAAMGRNAFRGPELFSYDAALYKNFAVRENFKLELRGEVYNVTNSTNYANPVSFAFRPGFGQTTRLFNNTGGRRFQFAARLLF